MALLDGGAARHRITMLLLDEGTPPHAHTRFHVAPR
jgi:hypothetical protein